MPYKNKMAVLKLRPSWNDKPSYRDDNTLRMFVWPYGTGELIGELKRVREILDVADKMQPNDLRPIPLEIEMAFQECFIDSHEMLMMLMDRLTDCWNSRALFDIINNIDSSVEGVAVAYKTANLLFQTTSDKFLLMRHLYEELKPETQSLIKQCSGPVQLERSMIAQKKEPVQTSSTGFVFQPACGFKFNAPSNTDQMTKQEASQEYKNSDLRVKLKDRITAIDMQVEGLLQEKNALEEDLKTLVVKDSDADDKK